MHRANVARGPIPECPGPDRHPHRPLRFVVPDRAVDTHAHVIGTEPHYPLIKERNYTAPEARPAAYLDMLDATGMTYGVLVQVSVHGTDNRLMLETVKASSGRLKGVAVAALGRPEREYQALRDAGVVGLRINVLFGGGVGMDVLEDYADLCRDIGWHLQLLLDARELSALAPRLSKLSVPLVFDHMGHFPAALGVDSQAFHLLLALVRDGAWVKLSAPYRLTDQPPPYPSTVPIARELAKAAPERCVWGSDWPHVANYGHMMNVGDLLDVLADWVPDEHARHRVLVTNPARLYGFRA